MTEPNDLRKFRFDLLKAEVRRCLGPGECTRSPIRAHSIQQAGVLQLLARAGHVIQFKCVPTQHETEIKTARVGVRKASTFYGLCGQHDADIFRPLETTNFDPSNREHLFLLAYRATLKELFACVNAAADLQVAYRKRVEIGWSPRDRPDPAGSFAMSRMIVAYETYQFKEILDSALENRSFDAISHDVYVYPGLRPTFAVRAMISIDEVQTDLGSGHVTLTVLPRDGDVCVIVSYPSDEAAAVRPWLQDLRETVGFHQRYEISKMILQRCDNIVFAPAFFENLAPSRRHAIERFFVQTMYGSEGQDAPDLYLFSDWSGNEE